MNRRCPPFPASSLRNFPLFASLLLVTLVGSAAAQEREMQVPIDQEGQLLEVTSELRAAVGLAPTVQGFEVARLFEQDDGTLILEISARQGGRLVRERSVLSADEADELRSRVTVALAELETTPVLSREGRSGLVLASTVLGLGFYGWALPASFDVDDSRTAVATYLLTAASSFYFPYRFTRNRSVTDAHRSLAIWGATRGALYGGTLGFAFTNRGGPDFDDDDEEWQARLAAAMGGSVAGSILGFKAVDWTGVDHGTSDLRETLVDFSTAGGFGLAYVLGLYDEETFEGPGGFPVREDPDLLPGNLLALGATGAGALGARLVGRGGTYTTGDVHVFRTFGLMGAQAFLPIANLVDDDEAKTHVAAAILGAAPGLFMGNRLLQNESFSSGDGVLVAAGHLAGGLLAAGVTYLFDPQGDSQDLIYLTTTAAGSAAGLAFTYRALRGGQGSSSAARSWETGDVDVAFNPTGLLPLLSGASTEGPTVRTPVISIRW